MTFPKVNPKQSFPALEEETLKFWKENKIFEESISSRPAENPYRFYDGPPFITGTPHYGSLLSSICKDVVPRYWTMKGKRCERVWGWDCHGLPIEDKVQKKLGIESAKDVEKIGVETFIKECYNYTQNTSAEWEWYIDHIGRWVDFKNSYKTMDQDYMESVMWVFKSLWDKELIYKGQRVSLYSWKLGTPISNFEVAMDDSYKEVSDPAITVMFDIIAGETNLEGRPVSVGDYLLAWTTTPWTIPTHMCIAVNKDLAYSRVLSEWKHYILATHRIETVFKGKEHEVVASFMGESLVWLKYNPPYDYYKGKVDEAKNFIVYHAEFVTDTDGTGIAHEAPEFWDVDFQLAKANGVHVTNALNNEGKYTSEIADMQGLHYQEANEVSIQRLKDMGKLFKKESINHRVAMCPRTDTPLIYKAQDSWFINIQSIKAKLVAENENINWYPEHLKYGQFLKSMEGAPDWCISRSRYWGTPMPVWMGYNKNGEVQDTKVFASRAEIEKASGMKITDLHKPYIDDITWSENGLIYKRVPEVLDVWMDSGSMPYAQMHYPFENKVSMESSYPADFIVEYIGQVRAWFYVMHVVWVALFDKNSFSNVITTGIVYGNDGRKMSKSYGNYPDPKITIQKYGADSIRFYMMNSPLLSGNNMSFKEDGIEEVIKKVMLPLWNTYSFFTTYANIDNFCPTWKYKRENPLDIWIFSELSKLIADVDTNLSNYRIAEASRVIPKFMDNLTNWYIRRSRKRFWKSDTDIDKIGAYETLYEVLVTVSKVIAPFMPFIAENIYKNLTGEKSVHLTDFPTAQKKLIKSDLNTDMDVTQKVINLGLSWRASNKIRVRQPLPSITIGEKLSTYYTDIIKEELNIKAVHIIDASQIAKKICKPNGRTIGPKFASNVKFIISEAKAGNFTELDDGKVQVGEFVLDPEDFEIAFETTDGQANIESGFGMVIAMDGTISEELKLEWYARDIIRQIQEARKEADYNVDDRIEISINSQNEDLQRSVNTFKEYITYETLSTLIENISSPDLEKEIDLEEVQFTLKLKK